MRFLYVGNFRPDHSTENHVARTLVALGHEVVYCQEDAVDETAVDAAIVTRRPDVLLWTRTWGWDPPIGRPFVESLRIPTVAYHLDRFWGLARQTLVDTDPMFSVDLLASTHDAPEWEAVGVRHLWLPPGVLDDEAYDAEPDPDRWGGHDVAFVGSRRYHPEWPHRRNLIRHLRRTYGERFLRVGDGNPTVRGDDLNRLYATVPIIVGDSCFAGPDERYWSDRVPETWGRGGFLLHPYCAALDGEMGLAMPSWSPPGNFPALDAQIERWLSRPDERDERRRKIARAVRSRSTLRVRIARLVEEIRTL